MGLATTGTIYESMLANGRVNIYLGERVLASLSMLRFVNIAKKYYFPKVLLRSGVNLATLMPMGYTSFHICSVKQQKFFNARLKMAMRRSYL